MQKILQNILSQAQRNSHNTTTEFYLRKNFHHFDLTNNSLLAPTEFKRSLSKAGIYLSESEYDLLIEAFLN